jgi:hypothetical protein
MTTQFAKQAADPAWANDKGMQDYLAFYAKYLPNESPDDFIGLSAYIISEGVRLVLERCGDDLTRDNLLRQSTHIEGVRLPMFLPGIEIRNSPEDYQLYHHLRVARFDGQKWMLLDEAAAPAPQTRR